MGTLYIDRRDVELDVRDGQLIVRDGQARPQGFPLGGLERVIVSGNVLLHARVLTRLAEGGTSVLLIEGRGARRHAQVGVGNHGDARRRVGQYRLCSDAQRTLRWSQLLVRARAMGLLRLYRGALRLRPDCRLPLLGVQRKLIERVSSVREVRELTSLRGLEGAIAGAHFNAYATLFSAELGFRGRNRRPPRDPVNAALSLGYTLTHSDAERACLIAGLDPMLGTLHEPAPGRSSLACDLNELARAHVEHLVWRLFAEKELRRENFEEHAGGVSLKKSARQVFWAAFESRAAAHRGMLRRAATAFARDCIQLGHGHGS